MSYDFKLFSLLKVSFILSIRNLSSYFFIALIIISSLSSESLDCNNLILLQIAKYGKPNASQKLVND